MAADFDQWLAVDMLVSHGASVEVIDNVPPERGISQSPILTGTQHSNVDCYRDARHQGQVFGVEGERENFCRAGRCALRES